MQKILAIFLMLFSCQFSFSASRDEYELTRQIIADQENKKVYGILDQVVEATEKDNFKKVVKKTIAVDVPTSTKVGTPMLQRVKHVAKTPGVQMVGTYAVIQLIEAIGWVMEDGTYIKKIDQEQDEDGYYHYACKTSVEPNKCGPEYGTGAKSSTAVGACQAIALATITVSGTNASQCRGYITENGPNSYSYVTGFYAGKFKATSPSNETKLPLTPALLGAAMLGEGYKDPDPNFDNDTVNTGVYTGVKEAYQHDPSGIGDELADAMDDKLRNAKPTPDGSPSYIGDPKYDGKTLTDGDTSADRSWDSDPTEATGESKPETDPETGQQTGGQSISIKFPIFCEWASSMCKWYDDWTKFTTEQPELKDEPLEIEDKEIIAYQREDHIQFGQTCPFSPQIKSLPLGVLGSLEFETDLTFICSFGAEARPYVLGIGHLGALIFLLIGLRNGNA